MCVSSCTSFWIILSGMFGLCVHSSTSFPLYDVFIDPRLLLRNPRSIIVNSLFIVIHHDRSDQDHCIWSVCEDRWYRVDCIIDIRYICVVNDCWFYRSKINKLFSLKHYAFENLLYLTRFPNPTHSIYMHHR